MYSLTENCNLNRLTDLNLTQQVVWNGSVFCCENVIFKIRQKSTESAFLERQSYQLIAFIEVFREKRYSWVFSEKSLTIDKKRIYCLKTIISTDVYWRDRYCQLNLHIFRFLTKMVFLVDDTLQFHLIGTRHNTMDLEPRYTRYTC